MEHRFRISIPRRLAVTFVLLLAALLTVPSQSEGAAPTNDLCTGALILPGVGPFPLSSALVNLTDATTTGLETSLTSNLCIDPVSRGVWFKFRPVTGGYYTLATCSPATTVDDTVMALYTSSSGCAGTFTEVDCNDFACGLDGNLASITTPLSADTDYYIVVWKYGTAAPAAGKGLVQLIISREVPPANDTCLTAQPVFLNTLVAGSTVLASNNYQLSGSACFTGVGQTAKTATGRDVVFTFTPEETDNYSFKVFNYRTDGDFDLVLYVGGFNAPGSGPKTVANCLGAANRNSVSTAEEVLCLPLVAGQQVYIYVDDAGDNIGSSFLLEVRRCRREIEPNNTTTNASPLLCGIEGSISPASDSDFFLVGRYPAGSRLFALLDGEAAGTPAFDLRVVTWTDTLEFDDADNDARFGDISPNIAGTPLPGGEVFLRVNAQPLIPAIEPYRLYTVVQPPTNNAVLEIEPNQTLALANTHPANYFYGSLAGPAPSADQDLYRFSAADGDLVFVSLDGDPARDGTPLNGQLELLDEFGNVLVVVSDTKNVSDTARTTNNLGAVMPSFPAEGLIYRCAEGTYYVRVSVGVDANQLPQSGPSGFGDYLLSIAKNCIRGESGFNTDPVLNGVTAAPAIMEGGTITLTGTAWDPDIGDTSTLEVNWGDGQTEMMNFTVPGLNPFSLHHQYPDNQPSGTYTISVTVTDVSSGTGLVNTPATVTNAPPALLNVAVTSPINVGSNAVLTGTISDPGVLDTFMLTVNWGDGSSVQNFNHPAGGGAFSHSHTYTTGGTNFLIQLALVDKDSGGAVASVPVQVQASAQAARFQGITPLGNGHMQLQLQGTPFATYRIVVSSDLTSWSDLGSATADAAGNFTFEDTSPPPGSRFYRAVAP